MTAFQQPSAFVSTSVFAPHALAAGPSRWTASSSYRRTSQLSPLQVRQLEQIQVLGGEVRDDTNPRARVDEIGHSGCVNALAWSESGELLASGSDDTKVILWKAGSAHQHPIAQRSSGSVIRDQRGYAKPALSTPTESPSLDYGQAAVIHTGHRANIFSVVFAPGLESRIVSAAGDSEIRVFDLHRSDESSSSSSRKWIQDKWYDDFDARSGGVACRTLRCHRRRAKRLATEMGSSDIFLSVAEDGDVRLHDLRTHHVCRENCPRPLLHSAIPLYSLSTSPLQPYLFAVAGMSPYSYLYDRRMIGRVLEEEWGRPIRPEEESLSTVCVRRFGVPQGRWSTPPSSRRDSQEGTGSPSSAQATATPRRPRRFYGEDHITAVKISEKTGQYLIASYSNGAVYRYGIQDEPGVMHHKRNSRLANGDTMECDNNKSSPVQGQKRRAGSQASEPERVDQPETQRPRVVGSTTPEGALAEDRTSDDDGSTGSDSSGDEMSEDEEEPTEQEANDFPLYRQLIADGQAGDLELFSDEDDEAGSEDDVEDDEIDPDDSDYDSYDDSDDNGDEDSELDQDPLPSDLVAGRSTTADHNATVPIVYPRQRYMGHANEETVKEVNFAGPQDRYIVSGSDDGNAFFWDSETGELLNILYGDGSVVNVIVPHPSLPVLAMSGIDDTVKVFGTASSDRSNEASKSRMSHRRVIVKRNLRRCSALEAEDLGDLFNEVMNAGPPRQNGRDAEAGYMAGAEDEGTEEVDDDDDDDDDAFDDRSENFLSHMIHEFAHRGFVRSEDGGLPERREYTDEDRPRVARGIDEWLLRAPRRTGAGEGESDLPPSSQDCRPM